jgi:hypothetical protein
VQPKKPKMKIWRVMSHQASITMLTMSNSVKAHLVSLSRYDSFTSGEERNIEMEIMETGGRVAGLALDQDEIGHAGGKNEFLIIRNQDYAKCNPMNFPVTFFLLPEPCRISSFLRSAAFVSQTKTKNWVSRRLSRKSLKYKTKSKK